MLIKYAVAWVYTYEVNSFVSCGKIVGGEHFSIICNYLGTPEYMCDATGDLVWHGVLDIYGRIDMKLGKRTDCPFRYQVQYEDVETGPYYNRFRYCHPDDGNYISQDPIGLAGGNPTLYGYVADSSLWIDPFGLDVKTGKDRA
ncbi:RHS repeat-associated core domain-containing protein [Myroides odoratimimus]|uniref:RHS repeat domain-containing protein n=1 Tax=Myroides odoratimimus TaxID=76832 RepID=UPI003100B77E